MRLQHLKEKGREVKLSEIDQTNYLYIEGGLDEILSLMEEDGIVEVREYIQLPYIITDLDLIGTLSISYKITGQSNTSGNNVEFDGVYVGEYHTNELCLLRKEGKSLEELYEALYQEIIKEDFKYNTHWKFNTNDNLGK